MRYCMHIAYSLSLHLLCGACVGQRHNVVSGALLQTEEKCLRNKKFFQKRQTAVQIHQALEILVTK